MVSRQKRAKERPEAQALRPSPKPTLRRASREQRGADQELMTAMQASYLRTLADEANEPEAFEASLSRREASKRICDLKDKLGLLDPSPHTD